MCEEGPQRLVLWEVGLPQLQGFPSVLLSQPHGPDARPLLLLLSLALLSLLVTRLCLFP